LISKEVSQPGPGVIAHDTKLPPVVSNQ
ncbi:MAG: hypothetical protein JWN96_261, partial [Mycobacterium sp.]|nr:hypothetical protein [Mycobacterium sp.]